MPAGAGGAPIEVVGEQGGGAAAAVIAAVAGRNQRGREENREDAFHAAGFDPRGAGAVTARWDVTALPESGSAPRRTPCLWCEGVSYALCRSEHPGGVRGRLRWRRSGSDEGRRPDEGRVLVVRAERPDRRSPGRGRSGERRLG